MNVGWQGFVEGRGQLQGCTAAFFRAQNLFVRIDLVNHVVVEAGLAEVALVRALTEVSLFFVPLAGNLALADLAVPDILDLVSCLLNPASDG